jgi:hypothetical protein
MEEVLVDLSGCRNISDDIIVYGRNQKENDINLRGVLEMFKQ